MRYVDVSSNPRIPVLLDMVRQMTLADDPQRLLDIFGDALRRAYGPRAYILLTTAGVPAGSYRIMRFLTHEGVDRVERADPTRPFCHDLPEQRGGFLGEMIRSSEPKVIHGLHVPVDPELGDALASYRSMMAVPLFRAGEPSDWAFLFRREPLGFDTDELEQLIVRSNLIGTAMSNLATTRELREATRWISREIDQIAELQRGLLPQSVPEIAGLSIATSFETFNRAGGDYWDVFPLRRARDGRPADPNGRFGFLIADASGHGPSAAVVAAMFYAILNTYPHEPRGPSEVLEYLNRHLFARPMHGSFVTAFFAIYDAATRKLTYARAGHNPPVVKSAGRGGPLRILDDVGGFPLGVDERVGSDEATITLEPGQTLVLYTDGIVEEVCPDNTQFGMKGLVHALDECDGEPQCLVRTLHRRLKEHQSWTRPDDDQTIVAIQLLASAPPPRADVSTADRQRDADAAAAPAPVNAVVAAVVDA